VKYFLCVILLPYVFHNLKCVLNLNELTAKLQETGGGGLVSGRKPKRNAETRLVRPGNAFPTVLPAGNAFPGRTSHVSQF